MFEKRFVCSHEKHIPVVHTHFTNMNTRYLDVRTINTRAYTSSYTYTASISSTYDMLLLLIAVPFAAGICHEDACPLSSIGSCLPYVAAKLLTTLLCLFIVCLSLCASRLSVMCLALVSCLSLRPPRSLSRSVSRSVSPSLCRSVRFPVSYTHLTLPTKA